MSPARLSSRVSDTVLELDTRSTGMFDRRWTRSQIDDLAAAFRLREQRGLTWEGVANALSSPPFAEQLDQEMEEVRAQLKQLAERANDLAEFANLIADDPNLAPRSVHAHRGRCSVTARFTRGGLCLDKDVSTTRREEAPAPTGTPV